MAKRGKLNKIKSVATIERPVRSRKYTYYILIVCEDERTEPDYFEKYQQLFFKILPRETIYIRPVGTGRNSLGVVECAKIQREKLRLESGMDVDQTWAVFDKDDLDQTAGNRKNFEDAFAVGEESNINIAYSNECFELWFLFLPGLSLLTAASPSGAVILGAGFDLLIQVPRYPLHDLHQLSGILLPQIFCQPGKHLGSPAALLCCHLPGLFRHREIDLPAVLVTVAAAYISPLLQRPQARRNGRLLQPHQRADLRGLDLPIRAVGMVHNTPQNRNLTSAQIRIAAPALDEMAESAEVLNQPAHIIFHLFHTNSLLLFCTL